MTAPTAFPGPLEGIGVRNFIQPLKLKTECTAATSAWKSPRVLSGYLARTAQSSQGESTLSLKAARRFPPRRNSAFEHGGVDLWVENARQSLGRSKAVVRCASTNDPNGSCQNITFTLWEAINLERVEQDLWRNEQDIQKVVQDIRDVEARLEAAAREDVEYLRGEKKCLQEEKNLLREEKNLLRKEKEQLRTEGIRDNTSEQPSKRPKTVQIPKEVLVELLAESYRKAKSSIVSLPW